MGQSINIGVSNVAREVKQPYIGVSSVAREVTNGYVGVSGVARQFYQSNSVIYDHGYNPYGLYISTTNIGNFEFQTDNIALTKETDGARTSCYLKSTEKFQVNDISDLKKLHAIITTPGSRYTLLYVQFAFYNSSNKVVDTIPYATIQTTANTTKGEYTAERTTHFSYDYDEMYKTYYSQYGAPYIGMGLYYHHYTQNDGEDDYYKLAKFNAYKIWLE